MKTIKKIINDIKNDTEAMEQAHKLTSPRPYKPRKYGWGFMVRWKRKPTKNEKERLIRYILKNKAIDVIQGVVNLY